MTYLATDSERAKRRVDQALDVLRRALVDYLSHMPRASRTAYARSDLQALLQAFVDRFIEMTLPIRTRNLAFAAKEARNDVAHYTGAMTDHEALRHLSNVRLLLKDLSADAAFKEVDQLYIEQLNAIQNPQTIRTESGEGPVISPAETSKSLPRAPETEGAQGKYRALHHHLSSLAGDKWIAMFPDVEAILKRSLPRSARRHKAWWSNTTTHTHAKAWLTAGWRTRDVDIHHESLSFVRVVSWERAPTSVRYPPGLICFEGDDAGYLDWLAHNRDGYVVNVRRTLNRDYVVLHRANCASVSAPREGGAYTGRGYRKFCGRTLATVSEAPVYCGRASGSFTNRCSHCNP